MKSQIEIKSKPIEIHEVKDIYRLEKAKRRYKESKTDKPDYDRYKEQTDFSLRHEKVKDRVISLLKFDKFARKNDLWLYLLYLNKMNFITLKIDINKFDKVNPPETISRARRQIYTEIKEGKYPELKYLIDSEKEEIRKDQEELYHDYYQDKLTSELSKRIK